MDLIVIGLMYSGGTGDLEQSTIVPKHDAKPPNHDKRY